MSEWTTDDEAERLPTERGPEDSAPTLVAEVTFSKTQPAECTIYPIDASDFEQLTTWITATEGSFVSLEDVR